MRATAPLPHPTQALARFSRPNLPTALSPARRSIKSIHIPEEVRSGVMNIFRVPLNAIMVVLLSLIEVQQVSIRTTLVSARPPP